MVITTTAIGFLLLSTGLAICGRLFFKALKKSENPTTDRKVGSLISKLFLNFAIQNGSMGLGMLIFAKNPESLFYTLVINNCVLTYIGSLGVYTAYYIFSPKSSPKFAIFSIIAIGISSVAVAFITHPQPFLTPQNGIDLNSGFALSLATFYLLFISIGSTVYIFTRLYLTTSGKIKNLSFLLALLGVFGIVNVFIRLIILNTANAATRTNLFDIGLGIIGLIFIGALLIIPAVKSRILTK